jgi:hypothetical protein
VYNGVVTIATSRNSTESSKIEAEFDDVGAFSDCTWQSTDGTIAQLLAKFGNLLTAFGLVADELASERSGVFSRFSVNRNEERVEPNSIFVGDHVGSRVGAAGRGRYSFQPLFENQITDDY